MSVNGHTFVNSWDFSFTLLCKKDHTTQDWEVGFSNYNLPVVQNHFSVAQLDTSGYFAMSGTFTDSTHASGTVTWQVPAFTMKRQVQLCTSGTPSWTARPSSISTTASAGATHTITFTKDASRQVHVKRSG